MKPKQRVLVIDDDPMIRRLVPVRLKSLNVQVDCVAEGHEGLESARGNPPNLLLLDVSMPGMDGFELCKALRDHATTRDIPVIFLTGADQNTEKQRGFALGAVDYVTKPFDAGELQARVRSALRMQALVEALETQALTDSLTGLPNRAAFLRHLSCRIDRFGRESGGGGQLAVLFIDLDRFKLINDSLGHEVGDQLLVNVADLLSKTVAELLGGDGPEAPFVSRLGGDEFTVLIGDAGETGGLEEAAEAIRQRLSEPMQIGEHRVVVGASIGIRLCDDDRLSASELLRDSDTAMYAAKARGKGRVVVFDRHMHEQAVNRLELEQDLRSAVAENHLRLHYQPIVNLEDRKIEAVEALVRWEHPRRGMVMPDQFIPIAEETGVIVDLGHWVLQEACRQLAEWRARCPGAADLLVTVNVSKAQLIAPDFVEKVLETVHGSAIDVGDICIEVTESSIMHDTSVVVPVLERLSDAGLRIAMDDFGTGYSSFASLHRFPISVLKIDRSFVAATSNSRAHAAVVNAIVTLADNLGMTVVAERVETREHLALLQAVDCAYGQGFLFRQPIPADRIARLLASGRMEEAPVSA
jgi:diguanylate cyclase (GGDEF)-like protein